MSAPVTSWPTIVVGVDGSEGNVAAVEYAAAEAVATQRPLRMVTAVGDGSTTMLPGAELVSEFHSKALLDMKEHVVAAHPGLTIRTVLERGHAVAMLLENGGAQDVLVVGKRGLGPVQRLLIGSTSIRVAARAAIPVIVVPPRWKLTTPATEPVVVGIDPAHPNQEALRFAFSRAARTGTDVVAVHAADLHPALSGSPDLSVALRNDWEQRAEEVLNDELKPIHAEFPEVAGRVIRQRGNAAGLLIAHGRRARLIVLGRRHDGLGSWGLGRVAREVLHEARVPVAIVPGATT